MSMPSPFELGGAIGGGVSRGIQQGAEIGAIDQILMQANETGDPAAIQNVMGQILQRVAPERQQAAASILQNKLGELQAKRAAKQQAQAFQEQGLNPSLAHLDKGVQKEFVKANQAQNLKQQGAKTALELVNRAREISKTGHLGPKFSPIGTGRKNFSTFSKEGQQLRAEYQQIGKALVQAAAPLKITNRSEFEHYAKDLEDPTRSLEEITGSLDAIERIIRCQSGLESKANEAKRPSLEEIFG